MGKCNEYILQLTNDTGLNFYSEKKYRYQVLYVYIFKRNYNTYKVTISASAAVTAMSSGS